MTCSDIQRVADKFNSALGEYATVEVQINPDLSGLVDAVTAAWELVQENTSSEPDYDTIRDIAGEAVDNIDFDYQFSDNVTSLIEDYNNDYLADKIRETMGDIFNGVDREQYDSMTAAYNHARNKNQVYLHALQLIKSTLEDLDLTENLKAVLEVAVKAREFSSYSSEHIGSDYRPDFQTALTALIDGPRVVDESANSGSNAS